MNIVNNYHKSKKYSVTKANRDEHVGKLIVGDKKYSISIIEQTIRFVDQRQVELTNSDKKILRNKNSNYYLIESPDFLILLREFGSLDKMTKFFVK